MNGFVLEQEGTKEQNINVSGEGTQEQNIGIDKEEKEEQEEITLEVEQLQEKTINIIGENLKEQEINITFENFTSITDHSKLQNLDFENSGHTGFQPAGDYALKEDIPNVSGFATKEEIPNISGLASKEEIPIKTSELENDSGFLTEHQDLSNYATKNEIPDVSGFASKSEIPDVSNLASKEEIPDKTSQLQNDSNFVDKEYVDNEIKNIDIPDVDLSNYYNKDEINGLANELIGMVPEIVPLEEYNPEEQYADNQITNANTMNYVVGMVSEAFNEVYENIEGVREEAQENIFTVNYTLNPQDMSITYVSHYSADIIQKYNEGKKVTFRGYVQGLNVYVNSELQLIDGELVYTYPLLRTNLGEGEKNYLFKIKISSNSTSVQMNEIGAGDGGEEDNIFIVEYTLNFNPLSVTAVSATQQEIVDVYNEGKKIMFYGSVVGTNVLLISELNSIDHNIPYTYPFMRTDLGEGIYNYFFRISVYREYGNVEAYALVDTNKLKQTEANFQNSLSNLAMSRPDTNTVVSIVNYYVNEIMNGYQNRLLPENVDEGTILKYVDGSWAAVEDDTFTVEYQLNPQTMTITEISNYSDDIIEAYNKGKTINFRCYVLGLGVYVSSDLNLIDGTIAYTMPIVRGDLGQGMMNYLFRVGVRASSTFVEVRVLQDIG